jgi:hypothetical protein
LGGIPKTLKQANESGSWSNHPILEGFIGFGVVWARLVVLGHMSQTWFFAGFYVAPSDLGRDAKGWICFNPPSNGCPNRVYHFCTCHFGTPFWPPLGTPLAKTCSIPRYHGNPMTPDVLATPLQIPVHSACSGFGRTSSPESLNISVQDPFDHQNPFWS